LRNQDRKIGGFCNQINPALVGQSAKKNLTFLLKPVQTCFGQFYWRQSYKSDFVFKQTKLFLKVLMVLYFKFVISIVAQSSFKRHALNQI
jgi:hypothetical protein